MLFLGGKKSHLSYQVQAYFKNEVKMKKYKA